MPEILTAKDVRSLDDAVALLRRELNIPETINEHRLRYDISTKHLGLSVNYQGQEVHSMFHSIEGCLFIAASVRNHTAVFGILLVDIDSDYSRLNSADYQGYFGFHGSSPSLKQGHLIINLLEKRTNDKIDVEFGRHDSWRDLPFLGIGEKGKPAEYVNPGITYLFTPQLLRR